MTRSLRKRHLVLWVVIAVMVAVIAILARMSTPTFAGEEPKTEVNS